MQKTKKFLTLLLVTLLVVLPIAKVKAATIIVAGYRDRHFIGESARERITLELDCDTINCVATLQGEDLENNWITIDIEDVSDNHHDVTFGFPADGSVTTVAWSLPAGTYKVSFYNCSDVPVNEARVYFAFEE